MFIRSRSVTDLFEGLVWPRRLLGLWDDNNAPASTPGGGGSSPSSGGASPAAVGSPASTPSGGTPAAEGPAATPSVAPGAEPPPDFMSIFDTPDSPPTVPAEPVVPAVAPAPVATPAPVVPPVTPAAAGPGEGGQPAGGTPAPASGQSPALDPYDPSGLAAAIMQNEQATIDYVAQSMFALTPEEAQALETDVMATVPKLFAKAFVKSQVNQLMQLARIIPEMVKRSTENMRNHTQNEDSFYRTWPQIDRNNPQHVDIVKRYGITYRTMNPNVSKEQMIKDLGPLVLMAAQIPLSSVTPAPTGVVQPASNGRAAPHQPTPFTPAQSGPAATVNTVEPNVWETMFQPRE